ncbi:MAG: OmpA family protein [Gemmatimonadota bacterium]|nr:MAG: OmpA family protein [Gemmatimonadota bacterium]
MISIHRHTRPISVAAALLISIGSTGCSNLSNTQRGAVIGAGAGGVVGAMVGGAAGSTTKGAIIGAVVGGAAGALIGRRMDDKARILANELDGATVERVGEGILVTFDSGVLFDFDSSALRHEARANLGELARVLSAEIGDYQLLVAGHTDASGSEEYNQHLSERRAEQAATFLAESGLPASQVRTVGRGEMEPIASNETETGQAQNRRVEFAIFASEAFREQARRRAG